MEENESAEDALENEAKDFMARLDQHYNKTTREKTIYHYTNPPALEAILNSKSFHMSSAQNLNDPTEISYGIRVVKEELKRRLKGNSRLHAILDKSISNLSTLTDRYCETFIASFSSNKDELGQWRAYGNDGEGFSIGIKREVIIEAFLKFIKNKNIIGFYFPVTYSTRGIENMLNFAEHELNRIYNKYQSNTKFNQQFILLLDVSILFIAMHLKHSAYKAEKEFRLLTFVELNKKSIILKKVVGLDFRDYLSFEWGNHTNIVRSIISGPSLEQNKARDFWNQCGQSVTIKKISHSSIPYRAR